jgi:hypothetical protein
MPRWARSPGQGPPVGQRRVQRELRDRAVERVDVRLEVVTPEDLAVAPAIPAAGHQRTAGGRICLDRVHRAGPGGHLDGAGPQVELVELQVMAYVDDLVQAAVSVHHRALEQQPAAGAVLDEQEADRAVRELRLVPDVQALPAAHRAYAAGSVALAVPAADRLLDPVDGKRPVVQPRLEEVLERGGPAAGVGNSHVVGSWRGGWRRRATDDNLARAVGDKKGQVGVPVADRPGRDVSPRQPAHLEEHGQPRRRFRSPVPAHPCVLTSRCSGARASP